MGHILLASGAGHLSARPPLWGFTWKTVGRAHWSAFGKKLDWTGVGELLLASTWCRRMQLLAFYHQCQIVPPQGAGKLHAPALQ